MDLRQRVSSGDRVKLDEYLESIRSIEKRIDRAAHERRLEGWQPTLTAPNIARPDERLPQDIPEHMRLMMDLIVLAFELDLTRSVTFTLCGEQGSVARTFTPLSLPFPHVPISLLLEFATSCAPRRSPGRSSSHVRL